MFINGYLNIHKHKLTITYQNGKSPFLIGSEGLHIALHLWSTLELLLVTVVLKKYKMLVVAFCKASRENIC